MSTSKRHRHPLVVSVGCGCRGSKIFFPGKQRPSSPSPHPPPSSLLKPQRLLPDAPSPATKQSSSDDLGPSISSSETFALGKSFSDEFSATTDEDDLSGLTFSGLLCQLNELEQSLLAWSTKDPLPRTPSPLPALPPPEKVSGEGRLGESVAVVKTSDDPLADFRWSMLQMIVEKEIVAVDDLRELLRCFLSLNSPQHHDLILRAFVEIWSEFFSPPPRGRHRHHHHDEQRGGVANYTFTPKYL
ncbi:transcription repressor OFP8-like [Nymphaea colorata]|uniref:Transcription repressor n=1 Tax=Nymphaea colorata TaxID=210225 RepID=A0A5K0ZW95_9MAGN|nr:transcription repressor OFP8-like [Nymphaea colorata]